MKQQFGRLLLMMVLPVLVSTGCRKVSSTDLKGDVPYYQLYNVTFDKTANSISGAAEFRVRDENGSLIELNDGALVKLNGLVGTATSTDKTRYLWATTGQLQELKLELQKNSGKTIINTVASNELPDIAFAANTPDSFIKTQGLVFNWAGAPLDTTKGYITASIESAASGAQYAVVEVKGSTVTFTPADLQILSQGPATLSMRRESWLSLKTPDDTAGGNIRIAITVSQPITIK